ncbi:MAG: PaaI family thioesterase [Pseudomonadota bacterium]
MAREPVMTVAELTAFLDEVFPQVRGQMIIEAVGPMTARVRMPVDEANLRPGGTVSGPSMFTLADCAYYAATLAMIGRQALTVTTSLTINFLSKPPAADLVCDAQILKLGRLLSVGEAMIWSAGRDDGPVAHASITYAIPPAR